MVEKAKLSTYETLLIEAIKSLAVDSGIVSSPVVIGNNALTDSTKDWANGVHKNRLVKIVRHTGAGQIAVISDNSRNTLVIRGGWFRGIAAGAVYVILEKDLAQVLQDVFGNLAQIVPIAKAAIFNIALPAAEANWIGADVTPTNSPSYLRIFACVSVTGILRVARTVSAVTLTEDLNSGIALVADAAYMFTVPWRTGDSINTRYSVTTGTIKRRFERTLGLVLNL